jgi:hypothetical protein
MAKEQERARNKGLSANPHIKGDAHSIEVAMPRAKHRAGTAKPTGKIRTQVRNANHGGSRLKGAGTHPIRRPEQRPSGDRGAAATL